jgi:hypothetical protein
MYHLSLYFKGTAPAQLIKTEFCTPQTTSPLISIRGSGLGTRHGSFQWSKGVRTLASFFTSLALWQKLGGKQEPPSLVGTIKSDARTLQVLLSKCPSWLEEMFGSSGTKGSTLERFLQTSAFKADGDPLYRVAFSHRAISELSIVVHWNDKPLESAASLSQLLSCLDSKPADSQPTYKPSVLPIFLTAIAPTNSGIPQEHEFRTELLIGLLQHPEFIPHDRAPDSNDRGVHLSYSLEKIDRKLLLQCALVDVVTKQVLEVVSLKGIAPHPNWQAVVNPLLDQISAAAFK